MDLPGSHSVLVFSPGKPTGILTKAFRGRILLAQAANEQVHRAFSRFQVVNMGRGAVAGDEVEILHDALGDVAMQVVTRREQAIWPNEISHCQEEIAFRIIDTTDVHRPMHIEVDAIERQRAMQ